MIQYGAILRGIATQVDISSFWAYTNSTIQMRGKKNPKTIPLFMIALKITSVIKMSLALLGHQRQDIIWSELWHLTKASGFWDRNVHQHRITHGMETTSTATHNYIITWYVHAEHTHIRTGFKMLFSIHYLIMSVVFLQMF